MSFEELGLSENLLKAIAECGYTDPTPIQAEAIPHALMARDVVGLAQTGTGKTASFTLPMIEILAGGRAKARMPRSLILTPTRELAAQIAENFDTYGKYTDLSKALLVGGVSMDEQVKKLDRGVDVLIATPGRLMDLFERGRILLNDIKILVIDEADRMLDMGFIPDIEKIAGLLPPMRQTLLFSATMPAPIKKLTEKFLSNPREVKVAPPASTAEKVEQKLLWVPKRKKDEALLSILKAAGEELVAAFVFCNRKRDIDGVCKYLKAKGYEARAMHGDMDQKSRMETLDLLRAQKVQILVCSDVAGRGIDVDHISHVVNYDIPRGADDYVHRIGRTGRAGREGKAFTLVVRDDDDKQVAAVQKLIGQTIAADEFQDGRSAGRTAGSSQKTDKPKGVKPTRSRRSRKTTEQNDDSGEDIVGFGDDIPAFLK